MATDKERKVANRLLQGWGVTLVCGAIGMAIILAAAFTDFDFISLNLKILNGIEKHEIDDILVGFALLFVGIVVDRWLSNRRKSRQAELAEERLKTLKATMRTVQDIVNNLLNGLQYFRTEADGALPQETLQEMDEIIEQAARRIRALGNLQEVKEMEMASGAGIEYESETVLNKS